MTKHLKGIVEGLQAHLEGSLKGNRVAVGHPVGKGDAVEHDWLSVLKDHLPHRYQADKAYVIDSLGEVSEQLDVVIYDRQYSPYLFNKSGQRFIPAESVYAVFEVKQDLSLDHVRYAGGKAASVRKLRRTSTQITHAGGVHEPRKDLPRITAGILTYESSWSPAFGAPFEAALEGLPLEEQLELGCVLREGAFEAAYAGSGAVSVELAASERSLVEFLLRLLRALQSKGTAPAIDYSAYMDAVARASALT